VPLVVFAEALEPLVIVDAFGLANALEHVLDAGHHALEAAEVDMSAVVERREHLIRRLGHLVLDVHLAARLVLVLARERIIEAHVVGVLRLVDLELFVIEEGLSAGNTQEEPRQALEILIPGIAFAEEAAHEAAEWRDAGARRHHDVGGVLLVLGHEQHLARGTSELDGVAGLTEILISQCTSIFSIKSTI
jgi:hypothetical protein